MPERYVPLRNLARNLAARLFEREVPSGRQLGLVALALANELERRAAEDAALPNEPFGDTLDRVLDLATTARWVLR